MTDRDTSNPSTSPEGAALADTAVQHSGISLMDGLCSTRAIRRYSADSVPDQVLRDILFAATRAPSGSNRQPFRFMVLRGGTRASTAKALIGSAAREIWGEKRRNDGYDKGSGADSASPKARMARTMQRYVEQIDAAPVLVLPCLVRYRAPDPMEGASMYPAVQNLLLAARAYDYGGVITGFHRPVEDQLKSLLGIPDEVFIACTLTLGRVQGRHGPVRRRPMRELVFGDHWGEAPDWAQDPPGTKHTSAGPPKKR